jgi:hypothetical protein
MALEKIPAAGLEAGSVNATAIAVNSVPSSRLTTTGVVANSYGNSSQIPVITVDTAGRITNASSASVAGVTGFSYSPANNTFAITTANGSTFAANISANSIAALALGSSGVVANTYGNSTAIPVITIDEDGRISNASMTSMSGVTGLSYAAANSTLTVSTGIGSYDAVLTSGNSSVQGLLQVVESVSNSSATVAASANSVKTAYELASNAVSNATSYAATAYSNAIAYAASNSYVNSTFLPLAGGTMTGSIANGTFTTLTTSNTVTINGGTANGVAFLNGSKVLTTGSALTFNGTSLGIGSAAYGDAGTITASIGVPGTTVGGLQLWSTTGATHYVNFGDSTSGTDTYRGYVGYAHGSDALVFGAATAEGFRLTSNSLYTASGIKVGIGTSNPIAQLHINQSATDAYTTLRLGNSGASGKTYEIGVGGNTSAAGYANNLYFYDATASVNRMVLNTSGNLGIGTDDPLSRLDVARSATTTSAFDQPVMRVINTGTATINQRVDIAMRWQDGTYNGIGGISMIRESATARSGALVFSPIASDGNGFAAMHLTSAGIVGIGTNNPDTSTLLTVAGAVTITGQNTGHGASRLKLGQDSSAVSQIRFYGANNSTAGILQFTGTSADGSVGAERMRIDSAGNLGVNNDSPAVLGSTTQVAIKANVSADAMFVAQNSNGLTTAKFGFQFTGSVDSPVIGSYSNHPFLFLTNNTERMRIHTEGGLSIGTAASRAKLHIDVGAVAGVVELVNLHNQSTTSGNGSSLTFSGYLPPASYATWRFAGIKGLYDTASVGANPSNWGGQLRFFVNRGAAADDFEDVLNITTGGNVGIGTTNPQYKLHVRGADATAVFCVGNTTEDTKLEVLTHQDDRVVLRATDSNTAARSLTLETGTSERVRISSGGNVSIGTISSLAKLHIEGNDIVLNTENSAQAKILYFRYSNGATVQSDSYLTFNTGGSPTQKMCILANGDVGIGYNAPDVRLEVNGGADGSVVFGGRSDGGNGNNRRFNLIAFADGGGAGYGGGLKIQTRDSVNVFADTVTVKSNGNVLLGTADRGSRLHVLQNETVTGGVAITGTTWVALDMLNSNADVNARNWKIATTYNSFGRFELLSGTASGTTDYVSCLSLYHNQSLALQGAVPQSGTGITFPATVSLSSNANTLDDYEEGTFAPTLLFASGSASTGGQSCNYTKIGNLVNVSGSFTVASVSSPNGLMRISNLPFNPSSAGFNGASASVVFYNTTSAYLYTFLAYTLTSSPDFYVRFTDGSGIVESSTYLKVNTEIWFNLTYRTSS